MSRGGVRESSREISIEACLRKLMAPKIDVLGHFRIYICFFAQLNTHWFMPSARKIIYIDTYIRLLWWFLVPFTPLNLLNYVLLFFLLGIFLILRCIYVDAFLLVLVHFIKRGNEATDRALSHVDLPAWPPINLYQLVC